MTWKWLMLRRWGKKKKGLVSRTRANRLSQNGGTCVLLTGPESCVGERGFISGVLQAQV